MNDNFVASGGYRGYSGERGRFMPDRPKDQESDSSRAEKASRKPKEDEKKKQAEEARKARERQRELEKERKESHESTEKTRKTAQQVAESLLPHEPKPKEQVPVEDNGFPEDKVVVQSETPLMASSRAHVIEALAKGKLDIEVPQDWDDLSKWGILQRAEWISEHNILAVTEFPEDYEKKPNEFYATMEPSEDEEYEGDGGETGEEVNIRSLQDAVKKLTDSLKAGEGEARRRDIHGALINYDFQLNSENYVIGRLMQLQHSTSLTEDETFEQHALEEHLTHVLGYVRSANVNTNFSFISRLNQTLENYERRVSSRSVERDLFERVTNRTYRDEVKSKKETIDVNFQKMKDKFTPEERADLFGDFDEEASSYRRGLGNIFPSLRGIQQNLGEAIQRSKNKELPTQKGLVDWYTTKVIENMQRQLEEEHAMGVPNEWQNSMKNVQNNLRLAESHDFSIHQIQGVLGRIGEIAEKIPVARVVGTTHAETLKLREEAIKLQDEINEIRESIEAILTLRETMWSSDMNPEKVLEVFGRSQWKDTSWNVYFERFFKDQEGDEFRDGEGKKFNMLDKAMQVYFKKFREEKRRMNFMEHLTKSKLTIGFVQPDFAATAEERAQFYWDQKWLILKLVKDPEKFGKILEVAKRPPRRLADGTVIEEDWSPDEIRAMIREQVNRAFDELSTADRAKLNEINKTWGTTKGVHVQFQPQIPITEWFRTNTLLGAHGTDSEGRNYLDIEKQGARQALERKLLEMGVSREDVIKHRDGQLLNQVINNAYHVTWMWGAFTEYGGIRVYNTDKKWYKDKNGKVHYQVADYIYSKDSRLFNGRMVDWYNEWLINENRGKGGGGRVGKKNDADYVFSKNMLGERKGILHHNRLLTKLINDNVRFGHQGIVRDGRAFGDYIHGKMSKLDNVDRLRLNWHGSEIDLADKDTDRYDYGWARGVAIAEGLEDGEISLEGVNWSEVFEDDRINVSRFNMADWWSDRAACFKFFGSGAMQKYLQVSGTQEFFKLNTIENFYSKREIRIKPWYKLIIPAHIEIGKHWKEWWKLPENMSTAEAEQIINAATQANRIEAVDEGWMMEKHLKFGPLKGYMPIRRLKEFMEFTRVMGKEGLKASPFILLWLFWGALKGMFTQGQAQLSGK